MNLECVLRTTLGGRMQTECWLITSGTMLFGDGVFGAKEV
jgi:hypothetical protein